MNYDESITRNDLLLRRLRLVSDIMEDYQQNIRSAFNLLELELSWIDSPHRQTQHQYSQGRHADARRNPIFSRTEEEPNALWNRAADLHRYFPNYARTQRTGSRRTSEPTQNRFIIDYLQQIHNNSEATGFTNEEIEMATTEIRFVDALATPENLTGETRTRTHPTPDGSLDPNAQNQCPITLDYFQPGQELLRVNGCGHLFSKPALIEWFNRHRECPVCRGRPVLRRRERVRNTRSTTTTPILFSATVELHNDTSSNDPSREASSQPASNVSAEQTNAVNTLISSLADGITNAFSRNEEYFEHEFTVALRDLMALSSPTSRMSLGTDASGSLPFS